MTICVKDAPAKQRSAEPAYRERECRRDAERTPEGRVGEGRGQSRSRSVVSEPRATSTAGRRREPRALARGERIADAWVHAVAIVAAVAAVITLLVVAVPRGNFAITLSVLIYGAGLLMMLISSALYNGLLLLPNRDLLRRIDHAVIFVMIAGTYTPFLAVSLPDPWRWWLLVYVWTVAGVGVLIKLIWVNHFVRLSVILYLFLGWTIVVAVEPLAAAVSPTGLVLLAVGGVLYSVGVVFHLWERLPFQQPIWHGFVTVAAACHYAAVMIDVVLPASRS